jgi:UDP-N-acetylglucosamine 2-epimerase (non-hydrolysing)
MSDVFFEQLGVPAPNVNLAVGSGSPAWQTAEIMTRLEPVLLDGKPDVVLVYGDVNSTVAAALVGAKLGVRVGHVEPGLRSSIAPCRRKSTGWSPISLLICSLTPSEDGDINLQKEGIPAERIFRVGNVMIDSLVRLLPAAQRQNRIRLPERYALVTLYRPANVDDGEILKRFSSLCLRSARIFPSYFPRTRGPESALPISDCRRTRYRSWPRCPIWSFLARSPAQPSSLPTPAPSRKRPRTLAFLA